MANNYDPVTSNLADFGRRELAELRDILTAWIDNGLPEDFYDEGVTVAFNRNSGFVFLTNEDYQAAILGDDGQLYSWYFTPYYGHEGTYYDLIDEVDDWADDVSDDYEYLKDLATEVYNDEETAAKLDALINAVNGEGDEDEEEE